MAQQMITLEEAADRLGLTPEEMKKRLKTDPEFKKLSQIRDGTTVRFKLSAIDELARQMGMASDPALPLAPLGNEESLGSDDFKVLGIEPPKKPSKKEPPQEEILDLGGDEEVDVFSLAEEPSTKKSPSSGRIQVPKPPSSGRLVPPKPPSSGRLVAPKSDKGMSDSSASERSTKSASDSSDGSSDSDVRLDGGKPRSKAPDVAAVPTEEIDLDFSGPGSAIIKEGSSAKLSAPKSSARLTPSDSGKGLSKQPPAESDSSEFELSLDADSDDFDLQMNTDSSDEVELGLMPEDKAGSGRHAGKSGINLRDPADSGISLEEKSKRKGPELTSEELAASDSDGSMDFELSLDTTDAASGSKLGAPKSGKIPLHSDSDSDSEFELTLDDSLGSSLEQAALGTADLEEVESNKGDIFETDFEIPPMPEEESGSEAVAIDSDTDLEKSDFELSVEDSDLVAEEPSESEVVLLEDETETEESPKKAKKGVKKAVEADEEEAEDEADVDLAEVEEDEDDASVSKALRGVKKRRSGDADEEEERSEMVVGGIPPTKPWGPVPVLLLTPSLLLMLVGVLLGFELIQTTWGYQQPRKPSTPLIRAVATQLGMELRDQ